MSRHVAFFLAPSLAFSLALAALGLFVLSACSQLGSESASGGSSINIADLPKRDDLVHHEEINANGEFTRHLVLKDPITSVLHAQSTVQVLHFNVANLNSQPSTNRVNIVFVGDGYTSNELTQYASDVSTNVAQMLEQDPYKTYQSYFSFHRVDVVSADSGVSGTSAGPKQTALSMAYGCSGIARLLCADVTAVSAAAKNAPAVDLVLALANSSVYGGAGYRSPAIATLAAQNLQTLEVALHEMGHSFAGLTDEYDTPGVPTTCDSFANSSSFSSTALEQAKLKWYRWLDLPQVGAFIGSCYSSHFYRPTVNSKMRALGNSYDPVNTEQFILKIYEKVKPIDSATPAGTYSHGVFWVRPMVPSDHALTVAWSVDGVVQPQWAQALQADSSALTKLTVGLHTISVTVTDPTPLVRDESMRQRWMSQTLSWNLVAP